MRQRRMGLGRVRLRHSVSCADERFGELYLNECNDGRAEHEATSLARA